MVKVWPTPLGLFIFDRASDVYPQTLPKLHLWFYFAILCFCFLGIAFFFILLQLLAKSQSPQRVPPVERIETTQNTSISPVHESRPPPSRREGAQSPSSPLPPTGKYSLLQYAMHHFRQSTE